jgi:hypothetical protein
VRRSAICLRGGRRKRWFVINVAVVRWDSWLLCAVSRVLADRACGPSRTEWSRTDCSSSSSGSSSCSSCLWSVPFAVAASSVLFAFAPPFFLLFFFLDFEAAPAVWSVEASVDVLNFSGLTLRTPEVQLTYHFP